MACVVTRVVVPVDEALARDLRAGEGGGGGDRAAGVGEVGADEGADGRGVGVRLDEDER